MAENHRAGTSLRSRWRFATDPLTPPPVRDPLTPPPVRDPRLGGPDARPGQLHRGMTLLATISLFIGTREAWTVAMESRPAVAGVISVCYASILVCAVLCLTVRTRRALVRVDVLVLLTALTLVACGYVLDHAGTDEGVLTAQAANEILHGHPVYGRPWPWLFGTATVGITKTMSGGADYTYGYPPLTALLAAPVHAVVHSTAAATLVTTGALLVSSVVLWLLLPTPWRSAATAVCLGFGFLPRYAYSGYPAITALALLVPVVVRWPRTGAGGRRAKSAVAAGLLVPALLCVVIAAAGPPPLRMSLAPRYATHHARTGVTAVDLRVVNTTGRTLTPHFASRTGQGASGWWVITSGPATLAPHAYADYVVRPPGGFRALPAGGRARTYLIAVTGTPMTITTVRVPPAPGTRLPSVRPS